MEEQKRVIVIPLDDHLLLRQHQTLIEQHELIAASLKRDFTRLIEQRYEIDMGKEDWVLDLNRGILERIGG